MTAPESTHLDMIGQPLKPGDCVVAPYHNHLMIGVITGMTPKMVKVKKLGNKRIGGKEYPKYSADLVLISGPEVTVYLLKNSG